MQLKQVFQNNESCVSQNAVEIPEYFEINDLKARLQDKDKTICKLKDTIKSLRENTKEQNVNHDKCEFETINKELENSVAKLLSEKERLCDEINHVKQIQLDKKKSSASLKIQRYSSDLPKCINPGELLLLLSTGVYLERLVVLTSFVSPELKSFEVAVCLQEGLRLEALRFGEQDYVLKEIEDPFVRN
ncbi:hypothetical protein Tco_0016958 [Tanacetum coccineum]